MNSLRVDLLQNGGATGDARPFRGGRAAFLVEATFDTSGKVTLQVKLPQGNYADVSTEAALSANGMAVVEIPPGEYRAKVESASAVYASIVGF